MLGRDVTEPAAGRAKEVEADDLENALAIPGVHVANVPELADQSSVEPGLLEHLPGSCVGRGLAGSEVPLREGPDDSCLAGRANRRDMPGAAQPPHDDATGRELA